MKCKRHKWLETGLRMLPTTIRRGCQEANAEMYRKCTECGKVERTGLLNVRPPAYICGQARS